MPTAGAAAGASFSTSFSTSVATPVSADVRSVAGLSQVLEAVAGGDEAAFATFYDHTVAAVYGIILRVVRDPSIAEEVTQEVYIELWRIAPRYDTDRGTPRSWATAIAHRRAVDRVRSEQAARDRDERDATRRETPHDNVIEEVVGRLDHERVGAALDLLSEPQRQALTLAYFGGHSYGKVARILAVPEGTVKSRIRDGLAKMRDILEVTL